MSLPMEYSPSSSTGIFGSYHYFDFFVKEEELQRKKEELEEIQRVKEIQRLKEEEILRQQAEQELKERERLLREREVRERLRKEREERLKEYQTRVTKIENIKEKKVKLLKESEKKREYFSKNYISAKTLNSKEYKEKKQKAKTFTNKILSKPCNGDPNDRNTLLHVLSGFSSSQGKECIFTDDTSNENSKFIGTMGSSKNQNCVLTLDNLDDVLVMDNIEETKSQDKEEVLKSQLIIIQEDLKNNKKNPVVENLKEKLAKAHGVTPDGIRINDVYYGSAHIDYDIIVEFKKKGEVTQDLKQQFKSYKEAKLHPLFFEESFNVNDFDERGHKKFGTGSTFKVGPPGHQQTYTQPTGWTRYGLKVLDGRYGNDHKWLAPFQDPKNWYRAFHGTAAEFGKLIVDGNGGDQAYFKPGKNQVRMDRKDDNLNTLSGGGKIRRGVYCSPIPQTAAGYCKNYVTITTKNGPMRFKFMFQVCVDPNKIQFCSGVKDYWVMPDEFPEGIRPYGILLKKE